MPELVPVRVRDCACPDTPHADEGDLVYLRPTFPLRGGLATQRLFMACRREDGTLDGDALTDGLVEAYVRFGAVGCNYADPFDVDALLADYALAVHVGDAADDLYAEAVLFPLGLSRSRTSPTGPTSD